MKKILFGITILLMIAAASGLAGGSQVADFPKISIPEANWDFGQIREGEVINHEFLVQNQGAADLVISAAIVSCECTTAIISKETIPVGKTGTIKVTFNSKGKNGFCSNTIKVCSNDPEMPFMRLRFWGTVGKRQETESRSQELE
jgi:hypothetical protein